jgi:hypothetical protein
VNARGAANASTRAADAVSGAATAATRSAVTTADDALAGTGRLTDEASVDGKAKVDAKVTTGSKSKSKPRRK